MNSSKKIGTVMMVATSVLILAVVLMTIYLAWQMLHSPSLYISLLYHARFGIAALIISGSAATWFLTELLLIMNRVRLGKAFSTKTVSSLRHMAICCIIACAAFAMLAIEIQTLTYGICAGILAFGALAVFTLACVFKEAVRYKEENDLTI